MRAHMYVAHTDGQTFQRMYVSEAISLKLLKVSQIERTINFLIFH